MLKFGQFVASVLSLACAAQITGCAISAEDPEAQNSLEGPQISDSEIEEILLKSVNSGDPIQNSTATKSDTIEQPVITPQAASSSSLAVTDGTRAAEAWFNRNGGDAACGGPCFALLDAKCDSHSVYVEYQINNGSVTRKTNGGGCGTTLRIPLSGNFNISYKACVDIQFGSDICGPTRFDHNP